MLARIANTRCKVWQKPAVHDKLHVTIAGMSWSRHRFDATDSITICPFTTDETDALLFRLPVQPNERNGLRATCRLMVDKITTVPKTRFGARVGRIDDEDILRLNQAVLVFLGLAVSPRTRQA